MQTKQEQKVFTFTHKNGDVFTYNNDEHEYKLNGIVLPGTTTPLTLVNELSWNKKGVMSDKTQIIKNWALKLMYTKALELYDITIPTTREEFDTLITTAKKAPNQRFKDAGISGTEIHELIEGLIKNAIANGGTMTQLTTNVPQVQNFINWANNNKVKFLFSEEPLYSKEWMNCGTVDFICEIDGKVLIGDIKTNGDKRRYESVCIKGEWIEDKTQPQSDIHIPALWQTGCYGKMATEDDARKLIDKFDGVVIVNIKKSGDFDEKLDVRYDYDWESLVRAYDHVIWLYKEFRRKI